MSCRTDLWRASYSAGVPAAAVPGGSGAALGILAWEKKESLRDAAGGDGRFWLVECLVGGRVATSFSAESTPRPRAGEVFVESTLWHCPRHGRCCRCATDCAALVCFVSVVSLSPSTGGREGNFKVGGDMEVASGFIADDGSESHGARFSQRSLGDFWNSRRRMRQESTDAGIGGTVRQRWSVRAAM